MTDKQKAQSLEEKIKVIIEEKITGYFPAHPFLVPNIVGIERATADILDLIRAEQKAFSEWKEYKKYRYGIDGLYWTIGSPHERFTTDQLIAKYERERDGE